MLPNVPRDLRLILLILFISNFALAHIDPWMGLDQIENELKAKPEDVSLLIDKTHVLIRMGRLDEAKVTLQRVDQLEKEKSADSTFTYIFFYQKSGNDKKAFELSNWGIKQFPDNYYQWNIRAVIAMKTGRVSEAIEALSKCLSIDPKGNLYNYVFLADTLMKRDKKGDKEKALAAVRQGIANFTNAIDASQLLHLSIRINTELKHFDDAIKNIESLEKLFGKRIPYAVKRAEILELAGRQQEIIDAYDEVISMLNALPEQKQNTQTDKMRASYMQKRASLHTNSPEHKP